MPEDAAPAHQPNIPVERIQQLPIPTEYQPVLMDTVRHVLANPERFTAAAERIDAELKAKATPDAECRFSPPVWWLVDMLPAAAGEEPPALTGPDYELWAHRLMLLATIATYPGDLSRFGMCGGIPWDHRPIHGHWGKQDTPISLPALGRAWILCDLDGNLRKGMLDEEGEGVIERTTRVEQGKPVDREIICTPWKRRGVLGLLVDRLKRILAELPPSQRSLIAGPRHGPEDAGDGGGTSTSTRQAAEEPPPTAGGKPVKSMTWQEAKKLAEDHCARNPFPGVNALAKIIRQETGRTCSKATIRKAIDRSAKLRALSVEHANRAKSVTTRPMPEGVIESVPGREPDPSDAAAESTDCLFQRLLEQATPEERAKLNAMTPEQRRELIATIESDPDEREQERRRKAGKPRSRQVVAAGGRDRSRS